MVDNDAPFISNAAASSMKDVTMVAVDGKANGKVADRPTTLSVSVEDMTTTNGQIEMAVNCTALQRERKKKKRPACYGRSETFDDLYEPTNESLGKGSQGHVRCYIQRQTGVEYAVKVIEKTDHYDRNKVLKEIDIFHHCQGHKNILQLLEYYEEPDKFYLVFHRIRGGSLLENIQRRGHLTELDACLVVRDIADALNFLHGKGIAHRDLKPENILCESKDNLIPVKICDFDLGNSILLEETTKTPVRTPELLTPVGSAEYMAPEVVDTWVGQAETYDKKCDLWSLGVILYIMLSGHPPFYVSCGGQDCGWERGESCQSCTDLLFRRIQSGTFDFPAAEWSHISDRAKDLIRHLLVRNPNLRYTAAQVLEHSWIQEPVPLTPLATPHLLTRNNSSNILEAYAENAMAFNRMMAIAQMTISEQSVSAAAERRAAPPLSASPDGFMFYFGGSRAHSSDGDELSGEQGADYDDEEVNGNSLYHDGLAPEGGRSAQVLVPLRPNRSDSSVIQLSPPVSKLALRRKLSRNLPAFCVGSPS